MADVTLFDIMSAATTRIGDLPEAGNGHLTIEFPEPQRITKSPTTLVVGGAVPIPNTIGQKFDRQQWRGGITIRTLVDINGRAPQERAVLYRLLPKFIDLFDPITNGGGSVGRILHTLPGPIRSFLYQGYTFGAFEYDASTRCYALDIYYQAEWDRQAQVIPIGGAP